MLVSEAGMIIAGHGRVRAAKKLGLTEVPVMVATGWTKAQIRAYALADNKLALNAGWDEELVALEIGRAAGDRLRHRPDRLHRRRDRGASARSRTQGLTDPDEAPEPPADPVSVAGDVWLLGRHRLLCGDSTSAADVTKVLGAVSPHLMVTDPPYGVEYDPAWRARGRRQSEQAAARQGRQRQPRRLARGLGAVSGLGRLRLACRPLRQHGAGVA